LFAVAKVKVVLEPDVPPLPVVEFLNLKSAPTAPNTLTSLFCAYLLTTLPPTTLYPVILLFSGSFSKTDSALNVISFLSVSCAGNLY